MLACAGRPGAVTVLRRGWRAAAAAKVPAPGARALLLRRFGDWERKGRCTDFS